MPTYTYQCKSCGHTFERFRAVHLRKRTLRCALCKSMSIFVFNPSLMQVGVDDGKLPPSLRGYWLSADQNFETKAELRKYCRDNGKTSVFLEGNRNKNIKSKQERLRDGSAINDMSKDKKWQAAKQRMYRRYFGG